MTSGRGIKVDVDRCSSVWEGDEISSAVGTTGAKSSGAVRSGEATGPNEEGAKSWAGGGVLNVPAAIDDVLTSLGVDGPFEAELKLPFPVTSLFPAGTVEWGGGILARLAASDSCLLLRSASEVDGPDENRFFNVPKNPSFGF